MSSLPSCFSLLNDGYFTSLVNQIGEIESEAELQNLANEVMADISLLMSTLSSQLSFLAPIEALLTPPGASLGAIVSWITSLIGVLTAMYKPYAIMTEQLAQIAVEVATITAALEAAASRIGVSITIPTPSIGCTL